MRRTYIVCYDIADPKRLRNVFKKMRAWGDHLQFSVFECQLRSVDLVRLRADLAEIITGISHIGSLQAQGAAQTR